MSVHPSSRSVFPRTPLVFSGAEGKGGSDGQVVNALEVAFEEVRSEGSKRPPGAPRTTEEGAGQGEIKQQIAQMLALGESFEASSQTMRKVKDLSEQASIVSVLYMNRIFAYEVCSLHEYHKYDTGT